MNQDPRKAKIGEIDANGVKVEIFKSYCTFIAECEIGPQTTLTLRDDTVEGVCNKIIQFLATRIKCP